MSPRINVEEGFWKDDRFLMLVNRVGLPKATGWMVLAWKLAQGFWVRGELIPEKVWNAHGFPKAMSDFDLAETRENGVYVRGSEKQFAWLIAKTKNGKLGGRPKTVDIEAQSAKTNDSDDLTKATETYGKATHKLPEPSLLSSLKEGGKIKRSAMRIDVPSTLPLVLDQPEKPVTKSKRFSDDTRAKMQAFIGAYASAYKTKYGGPPEGIRDKAIIGKVGHWIESVSVDRATELIQVYLQIDYRPIADSCHDLWLFFRHLNRIGNALSSGQDPGGINWNTVFGRAP